MVLEKDNTGVLSVVKPWWHHLNLLLVDFAIILNDICEKGLNYTYIGTPSYEQKRDIILLENNINMSRQTVYYHETVYGEVFMQRQEELNMKLLKEKGIEPTGYYHYDEQFPHINGKAMVRLSLVDAINNMVINDMTLDKEDFGKDMVKAFLEASLYGIPKEAIITDGTPMYREIIDNIGVKHQLCIIPL